MSLWICDRCSGLFGPDPSAGCPNCGCRSVTIAVFPANPPLQQHEVIHDMSFKASVNHAGVTHHVSGPSDGEAGRRVKLGFNPAGHSDTHMVKAFAAAYMQAVINAADTKIHEIEEEIACFDPPSSVPQKLKGALNDARRCKATALTNIESASHFAVASLYTRENVGWSVRENETPGVPGADIGDQSNQTDAEHLESRVRNAFDADVQKLVVTDVTFDQARRVFDAMEGIEVGASGTMCVGPEAGRRDISLRDEESRYLEVRFPAGPTEAA